MSLLDRVNNIEENECVVDVLRNEIASDENECKTCGKCVFGYEGTSQLEMILNDIIEKKGRSEDLDLMLDLAEFMKTQSLCEVGEDIADAVVYAANNYKDDITNHIQKKECKAGVCKKFMTFHILVSKCTGCGKCMDVCLDDAILGKKKFVHVINQKDCIQCGECLKIPDCEAIVLAGKKKPKCPKKPIPVRRK